MPETDIDYRLVGRACEALRCLDFTYVEAPWMVHRDFVMATIPSHVENPYVLNDGTMPVGSAEQGLLAMMEGLPRERYLFAAGPCFRNEPTDRLHQKSFFKVEMMYVVDTMFAYDDRGAIETMMKTSSAIHHDLFGRGIKIVPVRTGLTEYDLEINGIEVGSYGCRRQRVRDRNLIWIYGTALALPRASIAVGSK